MIISDLPQHFSAFQLWLDTWYTDNTIAPQSPTPLGQLILQLHKFNFLIWNQEDRVRRTDVPDAEIVATKRRIDSLNQQRNDAIEQIDEWLLNHRYRHLADKELPLRTETPGSAFDRLSVLALKIYHMQKQTERSDVDDTHIERCRQKLEILQLQRANLETALRGMFEDLEAGGIRMNIYRQFKMYNDPSLNPQLYQASR